MFKRKHPSKGSAEICSKGSILAKDHVKYFQKEEYLQINRKMINTIRFLFDLTIFRKAFSVCSTSTTQGSNLVQVKSRYFTKVYHKLTHCKGELKGGRELESNGEGEGGAEVMKPFVL